MKIKNEMWSIQQYKSLEGAIDPSPPFQRGPVWKLPAKQLLIDSILCEFDIPKVYLHDRGASALQRYAVTDGQQRLRAIWAFLNDEFEVSQNSYGQLDTCRGKRFSKLEKKYRQQILRFKLVTAVISDAMPDEIRELFWRLQQGAQLNPAEKRNCLPSQLGDIVRSMSENHAFFCSPTCPFSPYRRSRDDMCAHAFALEFNGTSCDLKAPNLKSLYEKYASGVDNAIQNAVRNNLLYLRDMMQNSPGCIQTKWGFVDLYLLVSQTEASSLPTPQVLAETFLAFEGQRLKYNAQPDQLLAGQRVSAKNRRLYEYIVAFKTSGALAKNLRTRHSVLLTELLS